MATAASGGDVGGGGELGDLAEALRDLTREAREAVERAAREWELERRIEENPLGVLGVAAAAGFVLGGGLWPLLRPFVKATARAALSPANLLAIGAALGAMRAAGSREELPEEEPDLGSEPH